MLALSISINKKQPNQRSLSQALRRQVVDPRPYCGAFNAVLATTAANASQYLTRSC